MLIDSSYKRVACENESGAWLAREGTQLSTSRVTASSLWIYGWDIPENNCRLGGLVFIRRPFELTRANPLKSKLGHVSFANCFISLFPFQLFHPLECLSGGQSLDRLVICAVSRGYYGHLHGFPLDSEYSHGYNASLPTWLGWKGYPVFVLLFVWISKSCTFASPPPLVCAPYQLVSCNH